MGATVSRTAAGTAVTLDFHAPPVVKAFIEDPGFVTGYFGPFGCAKALRNDALVLAPTGWVKIADLQLGDQVVAGSGEPTEVLGVYPQPVQPLWRVICADGTSLVTTADHLWAVETEWDRGGGAAADARRRGRGPKFLRQRRGIKIVTTDTIRRRIEARPRDRWSLPLPQPIRFPAQPTALDPYLVGVLLGDGGLTRGAVMVTSTDPQILDGVRSALPAGTTLRHVDRCNYRICGATNPGRDPKTRRFVSGSNPVLVALRGLGLIGRSSHTKFVPAVYLWNTPEVRLALLQGLLDTDGSATKTGNSVTFSSVSPALIEAVEFLVRSLGGVVWRHQPSVRVGQRITMSLPDGVPPFRLARKANRLQPHRPRGRPRRWITDVQPAGEGPSTCIRVAHPSGLFVAEHFLVTHNTSAGTVKAWCYAQAYPGARIAVIRATWPELRDTTQKTFFEWLPPGAVGHYEVTPKTFWLRTRGKPAEIIFRAMDTQDDIDDVLSLDLAAAWIDEPQGGVSMKDDGTLENQPGIAYRLYQALLGRLGRQKGYPPMLWMTGNPPSPSHWITQEFEYDPGLSGADTPRNPRHEVIELTDGSKVEAAFRLYLGTQDTNRANLTAGYYERLERLYGYDTPMARRFVYGLWIDFATEKPFKLGDIQTWGDEREQQPADLVIEGGIDPAISKKDTAATSAIVIAGQVRRGSDRGRIFELDHDEGHWSVYEQVDQMLKATRRWKVRTWRVEDVAYQRALGETLEHEARLAGITIHVDLVKPDADKLRRANAWSPLVEDGTILFRSCDSRLAKAMLAVPQNVAAWNLVDAAGLCFRGFPRLQPESARLPGHELSTQQRAKSYATRPALATMRPAAPVAIPILRPGQRPKAPGVKRAASYAVGARR